MLKKVAHYLSEGLWNFPLSQEKGWRLFLFKWLRISYLSIRGFYRDNCALSASSLTYYTLMALVPVLAMALAIASGFGFNEALRQQILDRFRDQSDAFVQIFKYADLFLDQAKGGVVAGVGVVTLFLTSAFLLSNLEGILNEIWSVKKQRSWRRIFSDYIAIMIVAPIFFVAASSASVFVEDLLEEIVRKLPISNFGINWLLFLVNLIPYCLFWILFTFLYLFMPKATVHFRSALLGGVVAGCLYVLLQWGYIYFQVGVNKYGAVYGSMAALPLLLIWLQLSWFVFLYGAELSCAHQTFKEHEFESKSTHISHSFRRLLTLWIVHLSLKGYLTKDILVHHYQIPPTLVNMILDELVSCHILHETRGGYVPSHQTQEFRISDLIEILDSKGERDFPFIVAKDMAPFEKALKSFSDSIASSPLNTRLSHVPHSI